MVCAHSLIKKNAWENFSSALLINIQFVNVTSNATSTSVGQE